jgi:hypothetical protein
MDRREQGPEVVSKKEGKKAIMPTGRGVVGRVVMPTGASEAGRMSVQNAREEEGLGFLEREKRRSDAAKVRSLLALLVPRYKY